ncbi:MAG TPA: DUF2911 domain-containing protein [Cytophagaceae bacterium]|jgi:hypothetical protein|nr:DUF2911 domain-containing protein [Cytophagaceae bacterium]
MKKKILISLAVLLLLGIGSAMYIGYSSRNLSPKGKANYSKNGLEITVNYGRPYKKGRIIFGNHEEEALVPYGKYWRLGANEATEITFNKDVTFGGEPVKAGTYRMYAVPGENNWTVYLNSELGQWGYFEANHEKDVKKITVAPATTPEIVEQFTIDFNDAVEGVDMNFNWDKTKVTVLIK